MKAAFILAYRGNGRSRVWNLMLWREPGERVEGGTRSSSRKAGINNALTPTPPSRNMLLNAHSTPILETRGLTPNRSHPSRHIARQDRIHAVAPAPSHPLHSPARKVASRANESHQKPQHATSCVAPAAENQAVGAVPHMRERPGNDYSQSFFSFSRFYVPDASFSEGDLSVIIYGTFELWGQLMLCGILSDSTFAFGSLVAKVSRGPEEDVEDAFCSNRRMHPSMFTHIFSSGPTTNTSPQANTYLSFFHIPWTVLVIPRLSKTKEMQKNPKVGSVDPHLLAPIPRFPAFQITSQIPQPNQCAAAPSSTTLLFSTPTPRNTYTRIRVYKG